MFLVCDALIEITVYYGGHTALLDVHLILHKVSRRRPVAVLVGISDVQKVETRMQPLSGELFFGAFCLGLIRIVSSERVCLNKTIKTDTRFDRVYTVWTIVYNEVCGWVCVFVYAAAKSVGSYLLCELVFSFISFSLFFCCCYGFTRVHVR